MKPTKSYEVPVFKTFYKEDGLILWQVDIAFDERRYCNCQIVKGMILQRADTSEVRI